MKSSDILLVHDIFQRRKKREGLPKYFKNKFTFKWSFFIGLR